MGFVILEAPAVADRVRRSHAERPSAAMLKREQGGNGALKLLMLGELAAVKGGGLASASPRHGTAAVITVAAAAVRLQPSKREGHHAC